MKWQVAKLAEAVQGRVSGDGSVEITGIASIESASTGDLVFVEDEKSLQRALASSASAVVAGEFATGGETSAHSASAAPGLCHGCRIA